MAIKTSRILDRVEAIQRQKLANAEESLAGIGADLRANPAAGLGAVAGAGLYGAAEGLVPGVMMGLGYGAAKGRPFTGSARGAVRGALTGAGGLAGAAAGGLGSLAAGTSPTTAAIATLLGGAAGGLGGWAGADKLMGKDLGEKRAAGEQEFANALQQMNVAQMKSEGLGDVARLGLTGLGVGAAARGLVGLVHALRNRPKKTRSGPAYLPMPYPAMPKTAGLGDYLSSFASGSEASSKAGMPWYGPAMMMGGLAGLYGGWKGMDKVIDARRQREMDSELDAARQQFHDALVGQYDEPVKVHPGMLGKTSSDATMKAVGEELDRLFEKVSAAREKQSVDWENLAGQGAGMYGMYAGLSGLGMGALMYDKIQKRSRQAILDKALKKRQRRLFMQRPTEIYAEPIPMEAAG